MVSKARKEMVIRTPDLSSEDNPDSDFAEDSFKVFLFGFVE